ncbi:hypothetical protein V8E52_007053 [Russula decolorans]|jgi:hypothetical protein
MRRYKILARILLMLSVIDFALTAPVAVQKHQVRVSAVDAAKDRTATLPLRRDPSDKWLANAADRTNVPPIPRSSDSGHWREHEPRQHNPRPRTDSKGLPEPSKPAPSIDLNADYYPSPSPSPPPPPPPTDEPDPLNPSSPHSNTDLNPSSLPDSHAWNLGSPSDPRPLRPGPSHDDVELISPSTRVTLPPDDSPQMALSPDESHSSSSWAPTDTHSGQTKSWSPDRYVSPSSSSWPVTYTHSGQTKSWSPYRHVSPPVSPPGQAQDHVPFPPNLGDHLPSDSHSLSSTAGYYLASPDEPSTAGYLGSPDESSTGESHPPIPGPTDNHPPPASSSNPGTSTEPNPPPSAKRPPPEEHESGSLLSKIPKGKFKRRISGSGAVH